MPRDIKSNTAEAALVLAALLACPGALFAEEIPDKARQTAERAGAVAMEEPQPAAPQYGAQAQTAPEGPKPKEGLVMAGRAYYDWKDYTSAIAKWEEALRIDPSDKDVASRIADARDRLARQQKKRQPEPQLPKDLAKKRPFFNLRQQQKAEKMQLNGAGKRWFSWFRKEENSPQLPAGQVMSLKDCIKIAERNSIQLQSAEESIRLAEMKTNEAKRNLLPSATMIAERYTGEINARQYVGMKNYIEGQQPVFAGGQLWNAVKRWQSSVEVSKCDYDKTRNDVILSVKKAYYSLGKARENLRIQQDLSKDVTVIYDRKKKEADFGVTSQLEFMNVGAQMSTVNLNLATAEGDLSVAELILKQSMNLDPLDTLLVEPDLEFGRLDVRYEEAIRAAYAHNPQIRMTTAALKVYDFERKMAAGKFWPKIDLLGQWGLSKEEYVPNDRLGPVTYPAAPNPDGTWSGTYDVDTKLWQQFYAGVKASAPIWGSTLEYQWMREQWTPVVSAYQGTEALSNTWKAKILDNLKIYSDKQQSQIDYDKARQELNKAKQDVTLEVRQGCVNYEKAVLQLDQAVRKVKYQEGDAEYNRFRASMDEVPVSTLVDSLIKLAQERYGYAQALNDCHATVAAINKAIGQEDFYKDEPVTENMNVSGTQPAASK